MSIRVPDSKHLSGHPRSMAKMVKDNNLIHNLNLHHLQRKAGLEIIQFLNEFTIRLLEFVGAFYSMGMHE